MAEESKTIDPSVPTFQPGSYDPEKGVLAYESRSIWWWDNGIWGEAGYALPNCGGKPTSGNETIRFIVNFIGAEMFALMHEPDVKFSRPFNVEWLFNLNKMLTLGRKRMGDASVGWTDKREGDADHATNTPQSFSVYPIPFFGARIRQVDALKWAGWALILLSECMQHSDNAYDDNITDAFASRVQMGLKRIQADMAMKYLGVTREETEKDDFVIPDTAFEAYDPTALFTSRELVEELHPELWWPTTNDLTPINKIPMTVAKVYCKPWPEAGDFGDGGAVEAAWPGGGTGIRVVPEPGARS